MVDKKVNLNYYVNISCQHYHLLIAEKFMVLIFYSKSGFSFKILGILLSR